MTMEIIIIGLVVFGLSVGILTARSSNRREVIRGGVMAQIFNYIACSLWTVVTPTVLISVLVLHVPILQALGIGFALVGCAFLSTMVYAVFEAPALARHEQMRKDEGWTAKDAMTSGL